MYEVHESQIAEVITKINKHDKIFTYTLLAVISIAGLMMASVLWELISSLAANMQSMAVNMQSMQNDINKMALYIHSMDKSMANMDVNIEDFNKMNPAGYLHANPDISVFDKLNPMELFKSDLKLR